MNKHRVELVSSSGHDWANAAGSVRLERIDGAWGATIDGYRIPDYDLVPETGLFAPMAADTIEELLESLAAQENVHVLLEGAAAVPLIGLA